MAAKVAEVSWATRPAHRRSSAGPLRRSLDQVSEATGERGDLGGSQQCPELPAVVAGQDSGALRSSGSARLAWRNSGTGFIEGRLPIYRETLVDTAVGIVVSLLSIAFQL